MENTTSDTTIQLHPVPNLNGPIRSYEIIVFSERNDNLKEECLQYKNTPYNSSLAPSPYTAAVLPAETLTGPRTFILGDNQHYNGFHNAPLTPNHNYTVYTRVTSQWKKVEKSSCAFAGFLQVAASSSSTNQIIAGSISAVILLLVLLLLLILWWSHSSRKSRRSSNIPLKAQTGLGKKKDIPVDQLLKVVKNFRQKELLDHDKVEEENTDLSPVGRYLEYQDLPAGLVRPCSVGLAEESQAKNRYKKVLPYDDSRVVLRSGPSRSDYINASYIDGYKAPKLYIATQGERPYHTLCPLTVKCERYWPEQSQTYGDITVSVQKVIQTGAITIRTSILKKVQSTVQNTVEQLQYLRWPDHGIPRNTSDLVQLIELMNKCNTPGSGPIIVHCSAGIGRTGTFIALDILLKMANAVKKVNVYNCVSEMRKKRLKMVQEKEQYIFLYDTLLEALLCGNTIIPVSDIQKHINHMAVRDSTTNMTGYDKEFQVLEKITDLYKIYRCKEGKKSENLEKNRNPDILPGDHWRPVLASVLSTQGTPGYINAVFVNSNSKEDALIVTQLPMKQTLDDFWAMVWDYKCTAMVMLQSAQDLHENGCKFFPDKGETGYRIFKVRATGRTAGNGYRSTTFTLRKTDETTNNSMEVKLWQLDSWPLNKPLPENPAAIISLIEEVEKTQLREPGSHILVTCCDGATRSGLFCAGIILCDQIRSDGCLDVSQAVHSLRRRRYQFIPNVDQYSFCYNLAQSYLNSFETYGNFK
ncbi:receptor-type tyrosine-protein phosphatase kappa-like [Pyxicephalus adspersus]|uniref:receptor-type tyrosine-protein phosphatase kappa-like n=1 Tax=Pyxicephalus adspersus TaxID=30357 RepID=UPI003B5AA15E